MEAGAEAEARNAITPLTDTEAFFLHHTRFTRTSTA
jgi:hypothetical protein